MHALASLLLLAPTIVPGLPAQSLIEEIGDEITEGRWLRDDWPAARKEAERSGRPIFALFRCVP